MINYSPLWETMRKRGISSTALLSKYNVPSSTIQRLKKNEVVSTYTLDRLCQILQCTVNDIIIISLNNTEGSSTEPTQTEPTQTKPTQTKPTQTKPTQTEPTQTKPTQTSVTPQLLTAELIALKSAQTHQLLRDTYQIPMHCSGYTYLFELIMQIYKNPKIDYSEALQNICSYFNKPYYTITSALRYTVKMIPVPLQTIPHTNHPLTVKTLTYLCVNTLREHNTAITSDKKELEPNENTGSSIEAIIINLLASQNITANTATSHKDFNRLIELINALYNEPHKPYADIFAEYSNTCNMHQNALHHNLSKLIQDKIPDTSLKKFVTSCVNQLLEKHPLS